MALGIDISNHQGAFDWDAAKTAGVEFAYAKASESGDFQDAYFLRNRVEAAKRGIPLGAYHYAQPSLNGAKAEAQFFAATVGAVRAGELRPALDYEATGGTAAWAVTFLSEVERLLGTRPVMYSFPAYLSGISSQTAYADLKQWPLWLASWGPNDGQVHAPPDLGFRMICQQYTSVGTLPGLPTLDLDTAASVEDLRDATDYLLWRDWKIAGADATKRPLGIPTALPNQWRDQMVPDKAGVLAYASTQTATLNAQIAALNTQIDGLNVQVASLASQVATLTGQISQDFVTIKALTDKIDKAKVDLA